MVETLLELDDLTIDFDVSAPFLQRLLTSGTSRRRLRAVDHVSLSIARGQSVALVGESGCGKSTLARLAVGLLRPSAGHVKFDGTDFARLKTRAALAPIRRRVQMIFQDPYASLNPRWRVRDIIAEPIRTHHLLSGRAAIEAKIETLLNQVGMVAQDGEKFPHAFSGGQRQRISIARALASEPEFLVLDEPTSALDVSVQAQILNLLKDLQHRLGLTYLFISHNLAVIYHVADRVGVMYLGRLVELADTAALFSRPRHPYTRLLLETVPDLEMTGRVRPAPIGEVPNPIDPPGGCAFHPRCGFANTRCRVETPELRNHGGSLAACHAVEEARLPDIA